LAIDIGFTGRGLIRPVVALGGVMFGRRIQRAITRGVDEAMADLLKERSVAGEFSASVVADAVMEDLLSSIAAVPTDPAERPTG
jgi:hypothetical protein